MTTTDAIRMQPAAPVGAPRFSRQGRLMFGVGHDLSGPIAGVPVGAKVRIRQRIDDFVFVDVRTPERIERWAVRLAEDGPTLCHLQAVNGVSCA